MHTNDTTFQATLSPMSQAAVVGQCSRCSKDFPAGVRKRCSRCRQVYYCSVECQREDWKVHKAQCVPTPADPDAPQNPQSTSKPAPQQVQEAEDHLEEHGLEEQILAAAGGFGDGNQLQRRQQEAERVREQLAQARSGDSMEIKFLNNGQRNSLWLEPHLTVSDLLEAVYEASARSASRLMFLTRKSQREEMFPGCKEDELLAFCAVSFLRDGNRVRQCMIDGMPLRDPDNVTLAKLRQRLVRRTARQAKLE